MQGGCEDDGEAKRFLALVICWGGGEVGSRGGMKETEKVGSGCGCGCGCDGGICCWYKDEVEGVGVGVDDI